MWTRLTQIVLALIAVSTVAGCSGQKIQTLKDAICCDGGYEYRYGDRFAAEKETDARLAALEKVRQRLSEELAAAKKGNDALSAKNRSLEEQLADHDRELTSSRTTLNQTSARNADLERQLADTQSGLASSQSQVSALQAGAGDSSKLAAELAAAQVTVAALQAGAGDKDKLADGRPE